MNRNVFRGHQSVLLDEVLEAFHVRPEGVYLDGTFGRGGHARAVLDNLGPRGRLLLMDRDPEAIAEARRELAMDPRVRLWQGNFSSMAEWSETATGLDGVLLDLGVSSPQLDDPTRGFSFQGDGPLDMRMDPSQGVSAAQWLARASESEISDVLWRYGEERMSRRIARAIVEQRGERALDSTRELAELIARSTGRRDPHKHPATRSFQALRICINDELGSLAAGLGAAARCLKPGGRLAVISFHSLEDRVVKNFIRGELPVAPRRGLPPPQVAPPPLRAVGRAQRASESEIARNPRARSAVLRVAEKPEGGVFERGAAP